MVFHWYTQGTQEKHASAQIRIKQMKPTQKGRSVCQAAEKKILARGPSNQGCGMVARQKNRTAGGALGRARERKRGSRDARRRGSGME
jgi:hypothetical protein